MQRDIEQAALAVFSDLGQPAYRALLEPAVCVHDPQTAWALRYKQASVRKKREAPGVLEAPCQLYDAKRMFLGRYDLSA
jgi:hypothetical protein